MPRANRGAIFSAVSAVLCVLAVGGWVGVDRTGARVGADLLNADRGADQRSPAAQPTPAPTPTALPGGTGPTAGAQVAPTVDPTPAPRLPERGSAEFVVAGLDGAAVPRGRAYTVEVERELVAALGLSAKKVAGTVDTVLGDPRGWSAQGFDLYRVSEGEDFRILLATPGTTDELCAPLQTRGRVSCRNGDLVVLNARRWTEGIPDYAGDRAGYRRYLVNHEVGHYLGHQHEYCPGRGLPAPVMMQQTYGLKGCTRNTRP